MRARSSLPPQLLLLRVARRALRAQRRPLLAGARRGGGIELAILARHYGRAIAAHDIQTKRVDTYGEGDGYSERVMLLYDGLHYDALAVAAYDGAPEALDVTVLREGSADADAAARGAEALVAACHEARQFTGARARARCRQPAGLAAPDLKARVRRAGPAHAAHVRPPLDLSAARRARHPSLNDRQTSPTSRCAAASARKG